MRYAIDCEFIEAGPRRPIDLVSIAVVAEDGREFYAVSTEFNPKHANPWVKDNVLANLPDRTVDPYDSPLRRMESCAWMPRDEIARRLLAFVGDDPKPEFWGWCCGYDYVLLSQLIGFGSWPDGWPYYVRDIQQEADRLGVNLEGGIDAPLSHDALDDARQIKRLHDWLMELAR